MKNKFKITDRQITDGCNDAYLKAGHNAYFGNGFSAGVEFALKLVNDNPANSDNDNCTIHGVSNPVNCAICGNELTDSEKEGGGNCCDLCWLSN